MDWDRAIRRNSEALKTILAALFAMLGDVAVERLPRELYRAVLGILRPAESALRRLIVIAARGMVEKPAPVRPMPRGLVIRRGGGKRLSFQLFDRRQRFVYRCKRRGPRVEPRIHVLGDPRAFRPLPPPPPDDGTVQARRLVLRLHAFKRALEDLPREARRLARWRARREKIPGFRFTSPLRPGRPPGYRKRPLHDVHRVLDDCHGLVSYAHPPDTG